MTAAELIQIMIQSIGVIGAVTAAVVAVFGLRQGKENHKALDGRMTELLSAEKAKSHAEGAAAETAKMTQMLPVVVPPIAVVATVNPPAQPPAT